MASQVYAHIQINQIIHIKYVQFFVFYINISIKLVKILLKNQKTLLPTKIDNNFLQDFQLKNFFSISNNNCISLYINKKNDSYQKNYVE